MSAVGSPFKRRAQKCGDEGHGRIESECVAAGGHPTRLCGIIALPLLRRVEKRVAGQTSVRPLRADCFREASAIELLRACKHHKVNEVANSA